MIAKHISVGATLAAATLLAACASKPPATPTIATPVAPPPTPRPVPPAGAAASLVIPPVGADGHYITINNGLTAEQTMWHVRSAYNVAALNCVGAEGANIVTAYNHLLHKQEKPLKAAYTASRKAHSSATAFDSHVTRVYNFFSQPSVKSEFCRIAQSSIAEANTTSDFRQFAISALPRLEAPFLDFYRRYDEYRRDLAAWTAGQATGARQVQTAAAAAPSRAPAPAAPAAVVTAAAWHVQLGAYSSEQGARSSWSEVRAKVSALAALQPKYEKVPAKSLVRLQAGPVADKATANSLCAAAIAAGQNCLPVAPTS